MKLSSIKNEVRKLQVTIAGEVLNCDWLPGNYTPELAKKAANAESEGAEAVGETLAIMIIPCLKSWDLVDDNDAVIPITPEIMETLGIGAQLAILSAMSADLNPQKPKPIASVGLGRANRG